MKGLKKCGLLLVLPIMLGLSFVVFSDTNALKHPISAMPLYNYVYFLPNDDTLTVPDPDFHFSVNDSTIIDNFDFDDTKSPVFFNATRNSLDDNCVWRGDGYYSDGNWISNGTSFYPSSSTLWIYNLSEGSSISPQDYCMQLGPFNNGTKPIFNWLSIPPYIDIVNRLSLNDDDINYEYLSYVYHNSFTSDTGFVYNSHGIDWGDFLGDNNVQLLNDSVSEINIPIGLIPDITSGSHDFTNITEGTHIDFHHEIYLTDITNYNSNLWDNVNIYLYSAGIYDNSNYTKYTSSFSCSKDDIIADYDESGEFLYGIRLSWTCGWTAPADFYHNAVGFNMRLYADGASLWDVTPDSSGFRINFFTDSIYAITNYDDTPGSSIGSNTDSGADISNMPGSAENQYNHGSSEPDWFSSLTSLFNFNIFNPFAPLFGLFINQDRCVNIPTLASMLHSNETQVCPWFDSSIRSIVTPVLGIASIMLLFGFVVHWLGARSGNLFEDSVSTDSFSFKSRVGRSKK